MSNKEEVIAIGKVEIIIKGEKHSLTMGEARKLKDALDGLFKTEVEYVPTNWGFHKFNNPWYGGGLHGYTGIGDRVSMEDKPKTLLDYKIEVS